MPLSSPNVCKMLVKVASSPKLLTRSSGNPCNDQKMYGNKCWLSQPKWLKIGYVQLPWMVSHSILCLFILEDWQIDLHPHTSSCSPCLLALPRPSHHGWLMGTLFISLIWTPSPAKEDLLEVFLSNCGVPCLLCHLLPLTAHLEWEFFHSVPTLLTSSIPTSALEPSSSKPCIHSLMLYAAVRVQFVFVVPQVFPGLLALVLFSTTSSAMAQQPSCTVLTIVSI